MPIDYTHPGSHEPAPLVHTFLGRPGPARSRRGLEDYLSPPARRDPGPGRARDPVARPGAARPAARPAAGTPGGVPAPPGVSGPARRPVASRPRPVAPEPAVVGAPRPAERRTVLDEDSPTVTLRASERPGGTVRATLTWQPGFSAAGVRLSTDVHLGCLWELRSGPSGIVQEAGGTFSAPGFGSRQVLRLGPRSEEGGEELLVDLTHVDTLRRVVLFATGRRGRPDWAALDALLTLQLPTGERLEMWLEEPPQPALSCAVASIHNVAGDLVIRRELEYLDGPQRAVAEAYGWDLDFDPDGVVPRAVTR